ncbi:hypothetical protein APA_2044 [Pseudanabaena sp. lw0831]|nr:hypothetical protein APA_2044 [Pseudanabaena sp. lw0831]
MYFTRFLGRRSHCKGKRKSWKAAIPNPRFLTRCTNFTAIPIGRLCLATHFCNPSSHSRMVQDLS